MTCGGVSFINCIQFVSFAEDFSDNEEMFAKEITKWSSNDLMDKMETMEVDEAQGQCTSRPHAHIQS